MRMLDTAFLRPGRFDHVLPIGAPDLAGRRKARALVGAQFALLATMALARRGNDWPMSRPVRIAAAATQSAGIGLVAWSAVALGPGLTASPLPNQRAVLRQDGPFGIVRHPIYSGLLLAAGARTVGSGNRRHLVLLTFLAGLLNYKARFEEQALAERFPGYPEYAQRTGRLLPTWRRGDAHLGRS